MKVEPVEVLKSNARDVWYEPWALTILSGRYGKSG